LLQLAEFAELQSLSLALNLLTTAAPLVGLTALSRLNLSHNSLEAASGTALVTLLQQNPLERLSVAHCPLLGPAAVLQLCAGTQISGNFVGNFFRDLLIFFLYLAVRDSALCELDLINTGATAAESGAISAHLRACPSLTTVTAGALYRRESKVLSQNSGSGASLGKVDFRPEWLTLTEVNLSYVNLSVSHNSIVPQLAKSTSLKQLHLDGCGIADAHILECWSSYEHLLETLTFLSLW
jgi:Leucine-rich repeat (LRR) protein